MENLRFHKINSKYKDFYYITFSVLMVGRTKESNKDYLFCGYF